MLRYSVHRDNELPLRNLVHGIDMIHSFFPITVSLMYRIDANMPGHPSWIRPCPFGDVHHRRFGFRIPFGNVPIQVTSAQVVEVGNGYPGDSPVAHMAIRCPFPFHDLLWWPYRSDSHVAHRSWTAGQCLPVYTSGETGAFYHVTFLIATVGCSDISVGIPVPGNNHSLSLRTAESPPSQLS